MRWVSILMLPLRSSSPTSLFLHSLPLLALGLTLISPAAFACRYSVRDTGFVDLSDTPYHVVLTLPHDPALLDRFRPLATATFLDTNIDFLPRPTPDAAATLLLEDPQKRQLTLSTTNPLPTDPNAISALLEPIATSPLRNQLLQASLEAFAVVVLVEGTQPDLNARARTAIDAAITEVTRLLPSLPKPVTVPPKILTVPANQITAERIALWGLGIEPQPTPDPRLALVYGRGRRLGEPLDGPLITRTALQERLLIIGQDCECELDRSWMTGPVLPSRWDAPLQSLAARTLGFDPENPLVRAEVSRILQRGPSDTQRRRLTSPSLTLGYSEQFLDEDDDAFADEESQSDTLTLAAAPTPFPSNTPGPTPRNTTPTSSPPPTATDAPPLHENQPSRSPYAWVWPAALGAFFAAVFMTTRAVLRARKLHG